jgi:hypothetical protein
LAGGSSRMPDLVELVAAGRPVRPPPRPLVARREEATVMLVIFGAGAWWWLSSLGVAVYGTGHMVRPAPRASDPRFHPARLCSSRPVSRTGTAALALRWASQILPISGGGERSTCLESRRIRAVGLAGRGSGWRGRRRRPIPGTLDWTATGSQFHRAVAVASSSVVATWWEAQRLVAKPPATGGPSRERQDVPSD